LENFQFFLRLCEKFTLSHSQFCVPPKVTKLDELKNCGRVSPTNLITFAGTQNDYGELQGIFWWLNRHIGKKMHVVLSKIGR
jgi:hypothetical protein